MLSRVTVVTCVAAIGYFASVAHPAEPFKPDVAPATQPAKGEVAPEPQIPEPEGTLEELVATNRKLDEYLQKQQDLGEPITPSFVAIRSQTRRELYEAEAALARSRGDKEAERNALTRYVQGARDQYRVLHARFINGHAVSPVPMSMAHADLVKVKLLAAQADAAAEKAPATAPAPEKKAHADPAGPHNQPPEPVGTLEELVATSRELDAKLQRRQDLGEPITPAFLAIRSQARRQIYEAEAALARSRSDKEAERNALTRHVQGAREQYRRMYMLAMRVDGDVEGVLRVTRADFIQAKLMSTQADAAAEKVPAAGADANPALEQLALAEQGLQLALAQIEQGRDGYEQAAEWSARVAESARDPAVPKDRRSAALKAHVERMKAFETRTSQAVKAGVASQLDAVAAKYQLLQAERWLREAEAGR